MWQFGPILPVVFLALTACSESFDPGSLGAPASRPKNHVAVAPMSPPLPQTVPLKPTIPSAAIHLDEALQRLGRRFDGDVGLAVRDVATGWTSHYRGLDYFPQQSVSKLWVALGIFDRIDQGLLQPEREIVVRPEDLTLFHQPISAAVLRTGGYRTTIGELLFRALTQSDNTASDRLLTELGGADAVRTMLDAKGINGVRFGPGERLLQSQTAGLDWQQTYATGGRFYAARDALPEAARRQAFDAYVANPVDGATPYGIVDALARLSVGQLLSTQSTDRMLDVMSETRTGALRLRSGLQPGWRLAHKTGTGQVLEGEQAGYNDVGVLTSPGGRTYAIAVLIGRTSRPLSERSALIRGVVAATIEYDADFTAQLNAACSQSSSSLANHACQARSGAHEAAKGT